jgi:hypothetical protein
VPVHYEVDQGTVGSDCFDVEVAELTGDDVVDLVTVSDNHDVVIILAGLGDGRFAPSQSRIISGYTPSAVEVGYLNSDARLDISLASSSSDRMINYIQGANGNFSTSNTTSTLSGCCSGDSPNDLALGDINGDGFTDAVFPANSDAGFTRLLGNTSGTFGSAAFTSVFSDARDIELADMNGDGTLDVVMTSTSRSEISVSVGTGAGTFAGASFYDTDQSTQGRNPADFVVVDINGDGLLDVVTANATHDISIRIGVGGGTLGMLRTGAVRVGTVNDAPETIVSGDFNGDGLVDLAVQSDDGVSVLIGFGNGAFASPQFFQVGSLLTSVVAVDLDGDGFDDLVLSDSTTEELHTLMSLGAQ